tara:strand:- start:805 stop:1905 length:1101 start_codon:yes stop_codon:yes gene_type:complete
MNYKLSKIKRAKTAYLIIGRTFGQWLSPIFTGLLINILRVNVSFYMFLDWLFYSRVRQKKMVAPILVVGNPRSGTTFLHRYLVKHSFGSGTQLYQMLFPSIILQKLIKPFLPILEKVSPTKHHSTEAHQTSLNSVETDDASLLFRFLDGFFLYGFILSWAKEDLFEWVDPKKRDTSKRDFDWLESMWVRAQISNKEKRTVAKLFSISANVPRFLNRFPDAKLLYMIRDPLSVIPSGLSLVTGVLDKKFGFWNLPQEKRQHYINRLYKALVELQIRFHDDWVNDRFDKSSIMIVRFDRMMGDFEGLMSEIVTFTGHTFSDDLKKDIVKVAENQRNYVSKHKYDLAKFGLSEQQIKEDCKDIYKTFLS